MKKAHWIKARTVIAQCDGHLVVIRINRQGYFSARSMLLNIGQGSIERISQLLQCFLRQRRRDYGGH
jgi:hypothetical protein